MKPQRAISLLSTLHYIYLAARPDRLRHLMAAALRAPRFFVSLLAVASLLIAAEAGAATRTVTHLGDSGAGSLRATIAAADPGDEINFSVTGTISLTSGQLAVGKNLTITGPDANRLKIERNSASSTPAFRIFFISNGTNSGPTVKISGLTLAGGFLTDTFGDGGCIYNDAATLELTKCYLLGNVASKNGGAIYNDGAGSGRVASVTLDSCTLSYNYAFESGGAIYNNGSNGEAVTYMGNCTLFENHAALSARAVHTVTGSSGGFARVSFYSCTVVDDGPRGDAPDNGSIESIRSSVLPWNSIFYSRGSVTFVVQNGGGVTSYGYNLGQARDIPFLKGPEDRFSPEYPVDPAGVLDNGGPVPTLAVVAGPALDRGRTIMNVDARGRSRPYDFPAADNAPGGDGADIGAFEADDVLQATDIVTVNSLLDHDDGTCGVRDCTLREAVERMNAFAGTTSAQLKIRFADLPGRILLNKELNVEGGVQIEGPGARVLTLSAEPAGPRLDARVFNVGDLGPVVISGLTIRDGFVAGPDGSGNNGVGGGIVNYGDLTLNDCRLENNRAHGSAFSVAGGKGGDGRGGAIHNFKTLVLNRCTLSNNAAVGGAGGGGSSLSGVGGNGGGGLGGAISNLGTLALNNCTITGNTGRGGAGAPGRFGGNGGKGVAGIYNAASAMVVTATTISGNTGTGGAAGSGGKGTDPGNAGTAAGGVSADSNTANTIRNTIIAGNTGPAGPDAEGSFTSEGYNLIGVGDLSSGFNNTGDQVGTTAAPIDPKLASLKNNLGATDTMELLAGSPALDAGQSFGLASDQRGFARPVDLAAANAGDGSDIGAFEAAQELQPPVATRFANIATRLRVEAGDNVLIGGFIVTGTQPKKIIVRGIGTSLPFADKLANPTLELRDSSGALLEANDNWVDSPNKQAIIDSTIPPTNDLEPAIVATLPANNAGYTAIVRGVENGTGIAVVEAYDLDSSVDSKLANISTRGLVQTGDNVMIGGLIITGSSAQKVIVRAIGPSLPVNGALPDPFLELFDGNGNPMISNNNWKDTQQSEIEATTIPPSNDLESAIVTSLAPAAYTAVVSGANGTTGIAVVEAYALQ